MTRPQPEREGGAARAGGTRSRAVCRVWVSAEGESFVVLAPAWDEWLADAFDEPTGWRLCRRVGGDALALGVHEPGRDILWGMAPANPREPEH